MTDGARQQILARIRRANVAAAVEPIRAHPIPARARGTAAELRDRFVAMAFEAAATVDRIASMHDLPSAVRAFLDREGLPNTVILGPDSALRSISWAPDIEIGAGTVEAHGAVAVISWFAILVMDFVSLQTLF